MAGRRYLCYHSLRMELFIPVSVKDLCPIPFLVIAIFRNNHLFRPLGAYMTLQIDLKRMTINIAWLLPVHVNKIKVMNKRSIE